jgi:hypothetical protein
MAVTPSPSPTPTVYAYRSCASGDLKLGISPWLEQIGAVNFVLLTITNKGLTPCYLIGYPSIQAEDAAGVLPLSIKRPTNKYFVTINPPALVRLPSQGIGYVLLVQRSCRDVVDQRGIRNATKIEMTLPNDVDALTVIPHKQAGVDGIVVENSLTSCGDSVDESPFEPSLDAAEE